MSSFSYFFNLRLSRNILSFDWGLEHGSRLGLLLLLSFDKSTSLLFKLWGWVPGSAFSICMNLLSLGSFCNTVAIKSWEELRLKFDAVVSLPVKLDKRIYYYLLTKRYMKLGKSYILFYFIFNMNNYSKNFHFQSPYYTSLFLKGWSANRICAWYSRMICGDRSVFEMTYLREEPEKKLIFWGVSAFLI